MAAGNPKLRVDVDANTAKFNAAMREMRKQGVATGADLDKRLAAANAKVAAQAGKAQAGITRLLNVSSGGRFVLQNTAAQVGDMAVQFEQGTAASRVMAQQLPQLFGGFGALGGALGVALPLLGTVAAVGIPLAAMLLTVSDNSEEAAQEVKTFAERLDDARSAVDRAQDAMQAASRGGVKDLREIYGEVTKSVTELADALAAIEARAAGVKVTEALDASGMKTAGDTLREIIADREADLKRLEEQRTLLAGGLSVLEDRRASGGLVDAADLERFRKEISEVDAAIRALPSIPGATELSDATTQMAKLADAAREASDARDWGAVADTLAKMRDLAASLGVEIDQGFVAELTRAEDLARRAANGLDDAEGSADDLAGAAGGVTTALTDANAEARELVGNLRNAMAELARVTKGIQTAQRRALAQTRIRQATVGQPVERAGQLAREDFNEESGAAAYSMIRSGSASQLGKLADTADGIERGARAVAEAEASLRAAEDAYAESMRASREGGGGAGKGGGKDAPDADDILARGARELEQMQRRIDMIGKTEAEVASLQLQYRLLDEAKREGIDLDARSAATGETVRQAIARQAEEMERLSRAQMDASARQQAFANVTAQTEGVLVDTFMGATDSVKTFTEWLKRAALQYALFGKGPLAGALGGDFTGLFGSLLSFDGGGHTGSGSRSGGVDGKGGFHAILHPRERVIDETKGGLAGTSVVVHNHSGVAARTKSTALPGGGRLERVIIGEQVSAAMTTPGNPAHRSLRRMGARMPGEVT